jgi:hypothetical protein
MPPKWSSAGAVLGRFVLDPDEKVSGEPGSGADQGDQMGSVDRSQAVRGRFNELGRHGQFATYLDLARHLARSADDRPRRNLLSDAVVAGPVLLRIFKPFCCATSRRFVGH